MAISLGERTLWIQISAHKIGHVWHPSYAEEFPHVYLLTHICWNLHVYKLYNINIFDVTY